MGYSNLNLGNLRAALSITGADPDFIEQLRREDEQRRMQPSRPPSLPEGMQEALEKTGSSYRIPTRMDVGPVEVKGQVPDNPYGGDMKMDASEFDAGPKPPSEGRVPKMGASEFGVAPAAPSQRVPQMSEGDFVSPQEPRVFGGGANLPANMQQALEKTGSSYQIPGNPYNASAPAAKISDLVRQRAASANESMGSAFRAGDMESQQHAASSALHQDAMRGDNAIASQTNQMVAENNARRQAYIDQAKSIAASEGERPETRGKALSIIGTILSFIPGVNIIGEGMKMVSHALNGDQQKWDAKHAKNSELISAANEGRKAEEESTGRLLSQGKEAMAINAARYVNAFKAIEEGASSARAKETARGLANEIEQKYIATHYQELQDADKLQKENAKLGEAKHDKAAENELYNMSLEQLAQLRASGKLGKYGKLGEKVWEDRVSNQQKITGNELEQESKRASITKTEQELAAGPKLSEGDTKRDVLVQSAAPAYRRLKDLAETDSDKDGVADGELNRGATKEKWVPDLLRSKETLQQRNDVKRVLMSVLRNESGANVPDSEIEAMADAHGVNSGEPEVRAQALRDLLVSFAAMDTQGRIGGAKARDAADKAVTLVR